MALLDEHVGNLTNLEASHLLRRAGFGGSPTDRGNLTGVTAATAVAQLVDIGSTDPYLDQAGTPGTGVHGAPLADLPDDPVVPGMPTLIESDLIALKKAELPNGLRGHWLYRMRYTSQPFQEQYALFLHDHMPSDVEKVNSNIPQAVNFGNDGDPLMTLPMGKTQQCDIGMAGIPYDPLRKFKIVTTALKDQNYLFRTQGLDGFGDLLLAVVRDPAMMSYLDNFLNVAGRPQENMAREMMELFSLGVGNYSENDIQQIAKCLTGESFPNFTCPNSWDASYGFIPARHEPGSKTIFGSVNIPFSNSGQETVDVVQAIMAKQGVAPNAGLPGVAVYMAWKLCRWFVNEDIQLDPPDPIVLELATYMMGDDAGAYPNRRYAYDMKATIGKLLRSTFFFDTTNRFAVHKHPVDYLIGTLRGLELPELFASGGAGIASQSALMGMDLFQPPDVAGWYDGTAWLGAGAMVARYNWSNRLAHVIMDAPTVTPIVDAMPVSNGDHPGIVSFLGDSLFHDALTTEESSNLIDFLNSVPLNGLGGNPVLEKRRKIQGCVHVMLTMPKAHIK